MICQYFAIQMTRSKNRIFGGKIIVSVLHSTLQCSYCITGQDSCLLPDINTRRPKFDLFRRDSCPLYCVAIFLFCKQQSLVCSTNNTFDVSLPTKTATESLLANIYYHHLCSFKFKLFS